MANSDTAVSSAKVISKTQIIIDADPGQLHPESLRFVQKEDADIPIPITNVAPAGAETGKTVITLGETLDPRGQYQLFARDVGKVWSVQPSTSAILISTIIAASVVNNFVFTRYLGLCVFFGVSKKKDTAIGMGITFTMMAVLSGFLSWGLHQYALAPLKLGFLSIVAFIGIIACLVQALDTILRKVNPILHQKFGIYLVLITTNCIILAVPLLNATLNASFLEAMALSFGAGIGFALALFLMSCAREAVELAPIPQVFKGLPIAFILAGLFALGFLGFSGLRLL